MSKGNPFSAASGADQAEGLSMLLEAAMTVVSQKNTDAYDHLETDQGAQEKLATLPPLTVAAFWEVGGLLGNHIPQVLRIMAPIGTGHALDRAKNIAQLASTWKTPGLLDMVMEHVEPLGEDAQKQVRWAAMGKAISAHIKGHEQYGDIPTRLESLLSGGDVMNKHTFHEPPFLVWLMIMRMEADQARGLDQPEGLAGITRRGGELLNVLINQGLDLEAGGVINMNYKDTPYYSALHAACLVLDGSWGGKAAVDLLINHGADEERVLGATGELAREVIEAHPKRVAGRLGVMAGSTPIRAARKPGI